LRVLQNRRITKVGSNIPVPVDIRLISATNQNIEQMVINNEFREDLLYRINTIRIEMPPLRERGNDILLLTHFYLQKYAAKYAKYGLKLSNKAARNLLKYTWPGNVRELQHCIEKAVILSDDKVLSEKSFVLDKNINHQKDILQIQTIEEMEKEMIVACLHKENGSMSNAARRLGITRQTLYNKLRKYNITI